MLRFTLLLLSLAILQISAQNVTSSQIQMILVSRLVIKIKNLIKIPTWSISSDPSTPNQNFTIDNLNGVLMSRLYRMARRTVLFAFGFTETFNSPSTTLTVNGYIKKGNYNILVLDWSAYNKGNLTIAIKKAQEVGKIVGEKMKRTFALLIGNFELVG